MSLEDFYFISQIAAAAGIMFSLIFVGLQIRQSTRQAKADATEATHRAMNDWYSRQDERTAAIIVKATSDPGDLSFEERYQYFAITMPLIMNLQEAHAKWLDGSLDRDRWSFWDGFADALAKSAAADEVWKVRKSLFGARFQKYYQSKVDQSEGKPHPIPYLMDAMPPGA